MRKIWLTMAAAIVALAIHAQERTDTTSTQGSTEYRQESGVQGNTETLEGKSGTQGQYSPYWRTEDHESITRDDLPQGLLETLESSEYSGWENATIYHNKTSDDYMLIIQDNGSPKTFYFNKEGKALDTSSYSDLPKTNGEDVSTMPSDNMRQDDQSTDVDQATDNSTHTDQVTPSDNMREDQRNEVDQSNDDRSRTDEVLPSDNQSNKTDTERESVELQTTEPSTTDQGSVEIETTGPAPSSSWRAEDKIIIVADDIPASLRITLEDDQYKGWQNSTLYRNRTTGEYMVEVRDGSNTKVFYFDKEGKVLSNPGNND